MNKCACSCKKIEPIKPENHKKRGPYSDSWTVKFLLLAGLSVIVWIVAYIHISPISTWLSFDILGLEQDSQIGSAVQFFLYDTSKIFLLLLLMIYAIAFIRASFNVERVRDFLSGKRKSIGYLLGSTFGAVTPFCSCSSIPLFLGFTSARIPIGTSMSFLITSPLINEIAIVLLWGLLGWKFALIYMSVGMLAGMLGGALMDGLKAERWLQPFLINRMKSFSDQADASQTDTEHAKTDKLGIKNRHDFAIAETKMIVGRVWMWVIIGVGLGATLYGYMPEDFFKEHLGSGQWWSVPLSVIIGIPLYSNVAGVVPVMESLLAKGLPLGTTLAFCMSTIAASLPEVLMLKEVMTWKLLALFLGYLLVIFTLVGWLFNFVEYLL